MWDSGNIKWELIPSTNSPSGRSHHSAVMYNELMIIFGGRCEYGETNETWSLDLNDYNWKQFTNSHSPEPQAREGHSACVYGQCMYIIGGMNRLGDVLQEIWRFDIAASSWKKLKVNGLDSSKWARFGHSVVTLKEKAFIFGGVRPDKLRSNDLFVFNLETNTMSNMAKVEDCRPKERAWHSAGIHASQIIIFGGSTALHEELGDLWVYDINSREWRQRSTSKQSTSGLENAEEDNEARLADASRLKELDDSGVVVFKQLKKSPSERENFGSRRGMSSSARLVSIPENVLAASSNISNITQTPAQKNASKRSPLRTEAVQETVNENNIEITSAATIHINNADTGRNKKLNQSTSPETPIHGRSISQELQSVQSKQQGEQPDKNLNLSSSAAGHQQPQQHNSPIGIPLDSHINLKHELKAFFAANAPPNLEISNQMTPPPPPAQASSAFPRTLRRSSFIEIGEDNSLINRKLSSASISLLTPRNFYDSNDTKNTFFGRSQHDSSLVHQNIQPFIQARQFRDPSLLSAESGMGSIMLGLAELQQMTLSAVNFNRSRMDLKLLNALNSSVNPKKDIAEVEKALTVIEPSILSSVSASSAVAAVAQALQTGISVSGGSGARRSTALIGLDSYSRNRLNETDQGNDGLLLRSIAIQLGILKESQSGYQHIVNTPSNSNNTANQSRATISNLQFVEKDFRGEGSTRSSFKNQHNNNSNNLSNITEIVANPPSHSVLMNDLYGGEGADIVWGQHPAARSGHASCICDGGSLVFVVIGGDKRKGLYDDDVFMLKIV